MFQNFLEAVYVLVAMLPMLIYLDLIYTSAETIGHEAEAIVHFEWGECSQAVPGGELSTWPMRLPSLLAIGAYDVCWQSNAALGVARRV